MADQSSSSSPRKQASNHPVHQTLATAANLANLLPTGTVLAFQTFAPSFSNNGICHPSNKYLTAALTAMCAAFCLLSSFTDTYVDPAGKLHYGIATFSGLFIFGGLEENDGGSEIRSSLCTNSGGNRNRAELEKLKLRLVDFVHAFASLAMFLVFALSDSNVQKCYFSDVGSDWDSLFMNLPLGVGALCSFLFTIFPTTRRGVGLN